MSGKRTWFGNSTPQQRKLLFEVWERTKDIKEACRQARVSLRFFYYWRKRFEQGGYAELEDFKSRVAHKLPGKGASVEAEVIRLKTEHADWGKLRIAQEMAKANDWKAVISPNTVRRILQTAKMWPENAAKGKKRSSPSGSEG
jgi:transposase